MYSVLKKDTIEEESISHDKKTDRLNYNLDNFFLYKILFSITTN